ncbi:putative membrane protein [Chryseobacterium populi]|uniref:Putative membrane protein n=1 Tax=Chryseobacterium populi TaxID=1144316 RepID=J3CJT0_9FLAO|nr:putative membrane protein [Chryseobacterium populi]
MGVQAVSNAIGVIEIIIAFLLIFSVKFAFLKRYAGVAMTITFLVTLSYLFTTPGIWKIVDGIPVTDFFILKDVMFLGFGLTLFQNN